jgi:hypothetical protein
MFHDFFIFDASRIDVSVGTSRRGQIGYEAVLGSSWVDRSAMCRVFEAPSSDKYHETTRETRSDILVFFASRTWQEARGVVGKRGNVDAKCREDDGAASAGAVDRSPENASSPDPASDFIQRYPNGCGFAKNKLDYGGANVSPQTIVAKHASCDAAQRRIRVAIAMERPRTFPYRKLWSPEKRHAF